MMNLKRGLGMGLALAALAAVPAGANFSKSKSPKNSGPESSSEPEILGIDVAPEEPQMAEASPMPERRKPGKKADITLHFINEAARRKLHAKEITMREAMREVTIYSRLDNRTRRQLVQNIKYAHKLGSPEWQARAAEIKGGAHV